MGKRKKSAEATPGDGEQAGCSFSARNSENIMYTHYETASRGSEKCVVADGITLYTIGTGVK
jgi:hypothetical protein